jgi:hypothetical protein
VRHWVDDVTIRRARKTVNLVQGIVTVPPSRNGCLKPRGGGVHARRPGHRPGRSDAESMEAAEHGVTMSDAMVVQSKPIENEHGVQDEK